MDTQSSADAPQRRKLNLKPRDANAASKAEAERSSSGRSNPFGAAKPRESVLAAKQGKKEEDILREELEKQKITLRLTPEQNDQKQAAELAVKEVQDELEAETDSSKQEALKAEVAGRQEKLSSLVAGFEKLAIEKAKSGGGLRPSERRAQQMQQQGPGGYGELNGAAPYGQQGGPRGGYGGPPDARGFDYGNNRGRQGGGGGYDQPLAGGYQPAGGRGGYDNYAPNPQANGQQQSFGSRGSGGFDNYNSRGPGGGQPGGRNYSRGREENAGGFPGNYDQSYEPPATEYTSPFTQDRY